MKASLERIICTTDFSEFANLAIPYALALAKEFHARLFVCHIIDLPPAPLYGEAIVTPEEVPLRMEDYAKEELQHPCCRLGSGLGATDQHRKRSRRNSPSGGAGVRKHGGFGHPWGVAD